jgi:hypothetical protein
VGSLGIEDPPEPPAGFEPPGGSSFWFEAVPELEAVAKRVGE